MPSQCRTAGHLPPLVFGENGVIVSRYIPSRTMDPAECPRARVRAPARPRASSIARWLGQAVGDMLFFSPFQSSRTYVATSRRLGSTLPADIDAMLAATDKLSHSIAPYVPTLCHNDMLPANVLDDGRRVWIVDWEYAGMGHPLFDLAGFSANCGLLRRTRQRLPRQAIAGTARQEDVRELRVFKVASLLRDALWGVVQTVVSDLDVDYQEYARVYFEGFREAFSGLDDR